MARIRFFNDAGGITAPTLPTFTNNASGVPSTATVTVRSIPRYCAALFSRFDSTAANGRRQNRLPLIHTREFIILKNGSFSSESMSLIMRFEIDAMRTPAGSLPREWCPIARHARQEKAWQIGGGCPVQFWARTFLKSVSTTSNFGGSIGLTK
jgi:hypothetical protein